jgi:hypothetical protein
MRSVIHRRELQVRFFAWFLQMLRRQGRLGIFPRTRLHRWLLALLVVLLGLRLFLGVDDLLNGAFGGSSLFGGFGETVLADGL